MKVLFPAIFLFITLSGYCQTQDDYNIARNLFSESHQAHFHSHTFLPDSVSGNSTVFGLFWLYKRFIASQDAGHCRFYPSCSQYAVQSVDHYGFIAGVMNSLDRLMRCNSFSMVSYPKEKKTGLLYDPVY